MYQFFGALGDFEISFMGFIYPTISSPITTEEQEEMLDTQLWWIPMVNQYLFLIPTFGLLFMFSDTPKFHMGRAEDDKAIKSVNEIYDTGGDQA
jgi:hypothetical protein